MVIHMAHVYYKHPITSQEVLIDENKKGSIRILVDAGYVLDVEKNKVAEVARKKLVEKSESKKAPTKGDESKEAPAKGVKGKK